MIFCFLLDVPRYFLTCCFNHNISHCSTLIFVFYQIKTLKKNPWNPLFVFFLLHQSVVFLFSTILNSSAEMCRFVKKRFVHSSSPFENVVFSLSQPFCKFCALSCLFCFSTLLCHPHATDDIMKRVCVFFKLWGSTQTNSVHVCKWASSPYSCTNLQWLK